jgi:AcrR family transcriptional regulator
MNSADARGASRSRRKSQVPVITDPSTARGSATRRRLIDAARIVFERDGYVGAYTTEISDVAETARGSFYTYFESKDAIFRAVIEEFLDEVSRQTFHDHDAANNPWEAIRLANERYLKAWGKNAAMFSALDQAGAINPEFYGHYVELRDAFVQRYSAWLCRLQKDGMADSDLDPTYAASALSAMVEQSARLWIGRGESDDLELGVATLTKLWAQAIGLRQPSHEHL